VRADTGAQSHGVAHQTADPPIAIEERMDEVEPMVRSRHRKNALAHAQWREPVSCFETGHEAGDSLAAWGQVTADHHLMIRR
jgi:hypothetical protein